MMGRPLSEETLKRMRTLLFDQDLSTPLVASRLGLSERVVQTYRSQWVRSLEEAATALQGLIFVIGPDVPPNHRRSAGDAPGGSGPEDESGLQIT